MQTLSIFFFFNDTATTEIYTLSLHDALPIYGFNALSLQRPRSKKILFGFFEKRDRKSTRLNSSHLVISYAVFCLKKNRKMWQTCDQRFSCDAQPHLWQEGRWGAGSRLMTTGS